MEFEKPLPYNFENIEKIAAFIISNDGLDFQEKKKELRRAGHIDSEIDMGALMAIQACFMVIFGQVNGTWQRPPDITA